jgi:hypothetical protein
MKKLIFLLLLPICSFGQGILPGVVGSSERYRGSPAEEGKTYTDVPTPPAFSDTQTLTQAVSGTGIQSGDLGGKTDLLVGSNYIFMQFNGLSGTYRMKSLNWENVADWAEIGSPSPQDYAHSVAVADPNYSFYNLKFVDTDNMIKLAGANPARDFTYQNLILDGGAFAGFLINENVSGQDYGNFTYKNCRVLNTGGESWYNGKTGGGSLAYFRGITEVTDCYSENSGREALQFNGHTDLRVTGFLAVNGGLDTGAGIGQNNCIQVQDVYTGYVKKSVFWNFPAFAMLATDDFLFEDCFFYFTDDDRTCFLQSLPSNGYTEMVHVGGTLTFRRCTFYNPNFTNNVMFTMQGGTRNYVWEDCIFPASVNDVGTNDNTTNEICDDQRFDKVTYTVTITGSTYTDTPNIPQFCDEPGYEGYGKVICDDYYYNLGYGPRNPNR